MSRMDLAAKYGLKKNVRKLLNAAIRAEIPGGAVAIDQLTELRLAEQRAPGDKGLKTGLIAVRRILDAMAADIRERYGMQEDTEDTEDPAE